MVRLSVVALSVAWISAFSVSLPPAYARDTFIKSTKETLTLSQSLERAYRSNPRLLQAGKGLTIARAYSREAKSHYYPKVNLNLNYIRYRNETFGLTMPELGVTTLHPTHVDAENLGVGVTAADLYYSRVGFVQTLFAGGKITNTHRLSRANVKRAESEYETIRREVEYETTQSFLLLLVYREKLERVNNALADLKRMERTPLPRPASMAMARTKADLRKRLAELERDSRETRMTYLQSMGIELFNDVDIDGSLEIPLEIPDLQRILAWAKQNRSDIRQTALQAEVDQLSVNLSLAERYPVFLLGGSYEIRDRHIPMNDYNWNTGISMSIPLFDGFSSLSRIRASRARADQSRLQKVQLEDQVEREVRSAYQALIHWREEISQRNAELAGLEKERGAVVSSGDMVLRMSYIGWRLDAQLDVVEALAQLNLAKASLEKAVGRPISGS